MTDFRVPARVVRPRNGTTTSGHACQVGLARGESDVRSAGYDPARRGLTAELERLPPEHATDRAAPSVPRLRERGRPCPAPS